MTTVNSVTGGSNATTSSATPKLSSIDPMQFLNIMIKEMQQQDPFQPMSSQDLINQVGQIRNMQSSLDLSTTLKDLALTQRLSSAGTLLGKQVTGKNDSGNDVSGLVKSVRREGNKVYLELDTGDKLSVDNVLAVDAPTAAATTTTTTKV